MDKIYPEKETVSTPLDLSPEEELTLKKALVLAIEKGIDHPQDRALDAVAGSGLTEARQAEVKAHLSQVADLEPGVRAEGAEIAVKVAKAIAEGKTDVLSLTPVIAQASKLVDAVIYAKRVVDVAEDRELTPIFVVEEKPIPEPDPEPIIEDGGGLEPIIEEKP